MSLRKSVTLVETVQCLETSSITMSQRRIRKEELERVVEDTLGRLGNLGRWQVTMYCLICLSFNLSGTWHMISIVFTGK